MVGDTALRALHRGPCGVDAAQVGVSDALVRHGGGAGHGAVADEEQVGHG